MSTLPPSAMTHALRIVERVGDGARLSWREGDRVADISVEPYRGLVPLHGRGAFLENLQTILAGNLAQAERRGAATLRVAVESVLQQCETAAHGNGIEPEASVAFVQIVGLIRRAIAAESIESTSPAPEKLVLAPEQRWEWLDDDGALLGVVQVVSMNAHSIEFRIDSDRSVVERTVSRCEFERFALLFNWVLRGGR